MRRKLEKLRGAAQSKYSGICKLGHILEHEGCSFSEKGKLKKQKNGKARRQKTGGWSELLHNMYQIYGLILFYFFNFNL